MCTGAPVHYERKTLPSTRPLCVMELFIVNASVTVKSKLTSCRRANDAVVDPFSLLSFVEVSTLTPCAYKEARLDGEPSARRSRRVAR